MSRYTIGVVGAGGMGKGIIRRFTAAGHTLIVTDSDMTVAAHAAAQNSDGEPGTAVAGTLEQVLAADVVVLALWYPGIIAFAQANAVALQGKTVVDIAIPLDASFTGLSIEPTTSAAEELAEAIPGSRIVKAFNTIPAVTLAQGRLDNVDLDTFVASDDAAAKAVIIDALTGSGLRALDAGLLANSRLLERLTAFGIELGQRYGLGFSFGFKFLPLAANLTESVQST